MPLSRMRFSHRGSSGSAASMDCETKPERLMYRRWNPASLARNPGSRARDILSPHACPRAPEWALDGTNFDTPGNFGRFSDAIPAPRSGAEFAASLSSSRFSDASSLASRLP
jgi:hypothetical protein